MSIHDVSAIVAVIVALAVGVERGFRFFSDRRDVAIKVSQQPVQDQSVLQGIYHALEKISDVLVELRADHRLQDRRLDDMHADLRRL